MPNSPAEQPVKTGRVAPDSTPTSGPIRGVVAQLGEHLHGMQGVGGSSPPSSTPSRNEVGCHEFRNHFGFYLERAAAGGEIEISRHGRPYARLVPAQAELRAA